MKTLYTSVLGLPSKTKVFLPIFREMCLLTVLPYCEKEVELDTKVCRIDGTEFSHLNYLITLHRFLPLFPGIQTFTIVYEH